MTLITDAMAAAVGTVVETRVSWPVSDTDIRRWALAVYYPAAPPERFLSTDPAVLTAPEEFNPFAWSGETAGSQFRGAADGLERRLGIPGPSVRHLLNAGSSVTYGTHIRPGDVITSVVTLRAYREREGRLGTMLLTDVESLWTNQHGVEVRRAVDTSIRY